MDKIAEAAAIKAMWEHMGQIKAFLDDETVQEVMINSPGDIWVERLGVMRKTELQFEARSIESVIRILTSLNSKNSHEQKPSPILDCKFPGLRIAAARSPIGVHGPAMCIRKHSARKLSVEDYLAAGAFDPLQMTRPGGEELPKELREAIKHGGKHIVEFLNWAIKARKTVLISGSTSSGKTTLLAALLDLIQEIDRVLILEDTSELSNLHLAIPNRVHLEANEELGVLIRDLVKLALRFRPTRIICGEIRGGEGFDVMNAYGTGHPGGLLTLHADSAAQALVSFEMKVRMSSDSREIPLSALRQQIAGTFDYVIQAANVIGTNPPRAPVEIVEVVGVDERTNFYQTRPLYSRFMH